MKDVIEQVNKQFKDPVRSFIHVIVFAYIWVLIMLCFSCRGFLFDCIYARVFLEDWASCSICNEGAWIVVMVIK
jgi:hypothetical protein